MLIKVLSKLGNNIKNYEEGAGKRSQLAKAPATMPDDLCLILRTYMVQDVNNSYHHPLTSLHTAYIPTHVLRSTCKLLSK